MIPICSFELRGFDPSTARYPDKGDWPEPIPDPPQERLRKLVYRFEDNAWIFRPAAFRGYNTGVPIEGLRLAAQFETKRGFLLFTTMSSGKLLSFYVMIYYVLSDFSGAEWAEIGGRDKRTATEWIRETLLWQWVERTGAPKAPDPLEETRIEDDENLLIKVRRFGWFRITLFEDEPKRFRFSSGQVKHRNGGWPYRCYFQIRKLRHAASLQQAAGPLGPQERAST